MSENKKIKLYFKGMTCSACETLIKNELEEVEYVKKVKVSLKDDLCEVYYKGDRPDLSKKLEHLKGHGYDSANEPFKKTKSLKANWEQWIYSGLIVLSFYLAYKYLQWIGITRLFEIDAGEASFGVAVLVGIVASMSTCLAVVGAVVISFSAKYDEKSKSVVKPNLLFHLGRLGSFFILGGLLGIIGSVVRINSAFMAIFTILIAVVLAIMALNIMGILPSISRFGIRMPRKFVVYWNKIKETEHKMAPVALGAFTFFLPCGFTQSMQLLAIGSGSFFTGGLVMLMFAIGTTPVLFGLGVMTSKFKQMKSVILQNAIGLIIIIFAFYTLSSGLAIFGVSLDLSSSSSVNEQSIVMDKDNVQHIVMTVDQYGFTPNKFLLKKDVPVKWTINGKLVSGCTNEIIVPSLGIKKKLKPGINIVEFTPTKTGKIGFSCWMGMVRGSFVVK